MAAGGAISEVALKKPGRFSLEAGFCAVLGTGPKWPGQKLRSVSILALKITRLEKGRAGSR